MRPPGGAAMGIINFARLFAPMVFFFAAKKKQKKRPIKMYREKLVYKLYRVTDEHRGVHP